MGPTNNPSNLPTNNPSNLPTNNPTSTPSIIPTNNPTLSIVTTYDTTLVTAERISSPESTTMGIKDTNITVIVCDNDTPCKQDIVCDVGRDCKVYCNEYSSCKKLNIFGSMYTEINCIGFESCEGTTFYGNLSSELQINCEGTNSSCTNVQVYCPFTANIDIAQKKCRISNNGKGGKDIHRNLDFYSLHGFYDLDLSNYSAELVMDWRDNKITNQMHCGPNFENSCYLNENLYCDCMDEGWFLRVVVGVCGLLLIVAIVLCVCCIRKQCKFGKKHDKKESKYSIVSAQSHDVEIVPIMESANPLVQLQAIAEHSD